MTEWIISRRYNIFSLLDLLENWSEIDWSEIYTTQLNYFYIEVICGWLRQTIADGTELWISPRVEGRLTLF